MKSTANPDSNRNRGDRHGGMLQEVIADADQPAGYSMTQIYDAAAEGNAEHGAPDLVQPSVEPPMSSPPPALVSPERAGLIYGHLSSIVSRQSDARGAGSPRSSPDTMTILRRCRRCGP